MTAGTGGRAWMAWAGLGALLLLAPVCAPAASLWDMEGIGRPLEGYDLAARAAGGTAIGVADPYGMSFVNPAAIAWARLPEAQVGYVTENHWIQVTSGTQHRGSGSLTGLRAAMPIWGPLRGAIGYRDLTDGAYSAKFRIEGFERTVSGSGGLGELSGTLAAVLWRERIALGAQYGFAQGTLTDKLVDAYNTTGFVNTNDLLRTRLDNGRVWSLGMNLRPVPAIVLGAVVQGANEFDVRGLWTTTSGEQLEQRARFDYPSSYGLGGSVRHGRNRLAVDWLSQAWAGSTFHLQPGGSFPGQVSSGFGPMADTYHLGIGYTRLPGEVTEKEPLLRRTTWSGGISFSRLPMMQSPAVSGGSPVQVKEVALSAGIGLPIQVDRGIVSGVLELGRTGNLGDVRLRETFVRIGVGVTFGRFRGRF